MKFINRRLYVTPYGLAKTAETSQRGKAATLMLITPTREAERSGWSPGMTFFVHVEDCVTPTVKESFKLVPYMDGFENSGK